MHLTSLQHQGSLILLRTDADSTIQYRVLRGAVGSPWRPLPIPQDPAGDPSVTASEASSGVDALLRSVYDTSDRGTIAPVCAVSESSHVVVFRASAQGTLLVDRFVLDSGGTRLSPTPEVRFKRSRRRLTPLAGSHDTRDYRDAKGNMFLEPTRELCFAGGIQEGRFCAVSTLARQQDRGRWHVFVARDGWLDHYQLERRGDSPFTVFDRGDEAGGQVPGIVHTRIELTDATGAPLTATGVPTATRYHDQRAIQDSDGHRRVIKSLTRVLLVVPTAGGAVTAAFAVTVDGSLAPVGQTTGIEERAVTRRPVMLSPRTLHEAARRTAAGPVAAPPREHGGLTFDGVSDHVVLGTGKDLALRDADFTVEAWVRLPAGATSVNILGSDGYGQDLGLHLVIKNGSAFMGFYANDTAGSQPVPTDQWVHLAWRYTRATGEQAIFVDGVLDVASPGHAPYRGESAVCLARIWAQHHGQLEICHVRVWSSALSDTRLLAARDGQVTGREPDLHRWWPLGMVEDGGLAHERVAGAHGAVHGAAPPLPVIPGTAGGARVLGLDSVHSLPWATGDRIAEQIELRFVGTVAGAPAFSGGPGVQSGAVESLSDGWLRLTAVHEAPVGATPLRALGLTLPGGSWSQVSLRGHRLETLVDRVCIERRTLRVALSDLGQPRAPVEAARAALGPKLRRQAALHRHSRALTAALNRAVGGDVSALERQVTDLDARIALEAARIEVLTTEIAAYAQQLHPWTPIRLLQDGTHWMTLVDGDVRVRKGAPGVREVFRMIHADPTQTQGFRFGDRVALMSCDDTLVQATNRVVPFIENKFFINGNDADAIYWVNASGSHIGPWETWVLVDPTDRGSTLPVTRSDRVYFRSDRTDYGASVMRKTFADNVIAGPEVYIHQFAWSIAAADGAPPLTASQVEHAAAVELHARLKRDREAAAQLLVLARDVDRLRADTAAANTAAATADTELDTALAGLLTTTNRPQTFELPVVLTGAAGLTLRAARLRFVAPPGRLTARSGVRGMVHLEGSSEDGTQLDVRLDPLQQRWYAGEPRAALHLRHGSLQPQTELGLAGGSFTVELWARRAPEERACCFVGHGVDLPQQGFSLGPQGDGRVAFVFWGLVLADPEEDDGDWHHWAAVWQAGTRTRQLYRDGVRVAADTGPIAVYEGRGPMLLGTGPWWSPTQGQLAEVRVWRAALGADEVRAHVHGRVRGDEPRLLRAWALDEGTGARAHDRAGWGDHAVVSGSPWAGSTAPTGRPGRGVLALDGNGYADAASGHSDLPAVTLEFWLRPDRMDGGVQFITSQGNERLEVHVGGPGILAHGLRFLPTPGVWVDVGPSRIAEGRWVHVACTYDPARSEAHIYLDGVDAGAVSTGAQPLSTPILATTSLHIGCRFDASHRMQGRMAELRIWNHARTAAQITASRHLVVQHAEGLIACWPLNTFEGMTVRDLVRGTTATVHGGSLPIDRELAVHPDAVARGEYGSVHTDEAGRNTGLLREVVVTEEQSPVAGLRIDALTLRWLGTTQLAPTLVGFMEGAPPVPSENLTMSDDYDGTSAVQLTLAEGLELSWSVENSHGYDTGLHVGVGLAGEVEVGWSLAANLTTSASFQVLGTVDISASAAWNSGSGISVSVARAAADRLELRGGPELSAPAFPEVGTRYVPKNIGYALVVSSVADVWALELENSGVMVGVEARPVPDVPPDINTVTFVMNEGYTMNGSLDGLIAGRSAGPAFDDALALRAQLGARHAASYFRVDEAAALERRIVDADKVREALALAATGAMSADVAGQISGRRGDTGDLGEDAPGESEMSSKAETAASEGRELAATGGVDSRRDAIARTAKRNLVNTYVWDCDGGLRTETEEFSTVATVVAGASVDVAAGFGVDAEWKGLGIGLEFQVTASYAFSRNEQTAVSRTRALSLSVELSGESRGINDHKDRPLFPGCKVDRYRFKSFYLEPAADHFRDFFQRVVDPEWLASADEEAAVLRRIDRGSASPCWRVLHRVTYVERPLGMGRADPAESLRATYAPEYVLPGTRDLPTTLTELEARVIGLEAKLDALLTKG